MAIEFKEFFKYAYYLMYVLVIITMGLVVVSEETFATSYFLACASAWLVLFIGLMLTRPVEYLYLISYFTNENRDGRYLCNLKYKLDDIAKIKNIEDRLRRHNDVELVGIQNIQLIAKTYHE